jgi:hypothetical protein
MPVKHKRHASRIEDAAPEFWMNYKLVGSFSDFAEGALACAKIRNVLAHSWLGNSFEGCMTSGASSTATGDVVQANIVAAGYGR